MQQWKVLQLHGHHETCCLCNFIPKILVNRSFSFCVTCKGCCQLRFLTAPSPTNHNKSLALGKVIALHNDKSALAVLNVTYSKNPYIRTLNFEGQAAVGSYLMITNANIKLLGS